MMDDDFFITRQDIVNVRQQIREWIDADDTWNNDLDGLDKSDIALIVADRFLQEVFKKSEQHAEEHRHLIKVFDKLEEKINAEPICMFQIQDPFNPQARIVCCQTAEIGTEPWRCKEHKGM